MNFSFCENCQKETAHKRALGAGTVIGFFLTCGLWALAIPFYPLRCLHCGTEEGSGPPVDAPAEQQFVFQEKMMNRRIGYAVLIGGVVLIFLLNWLIKFLN